MSCKKGGLTKKFFFLLEKVPSPSKKNCIGNLSRKNCLCFDYASEKGKERNLLHPLLRHMSIFQLKLCDASRKVDIVAKLTQLGLGGEKH